MIKWHRDPLPLGKPFKYIDIGIPHDYLSTPIAQKEYGYNPDNGNKQKPNKYPKKQSENMQNKNKSGYSGINIWEICRQNSVNLK